MSKDDDEKTCPDGECWHNPGKCVRAVLVDALLIVGVYAALAMALDKGDTLSVDGVLRFVAVFVPAAMAVRVLRVDYSDQLPRVALFHLATKIFNVLAL
jgi:hypothetical protein